MENHPEKCWNSDMTIEKITTIDEYINQYEGDKKLKLVKLRSLIKKIAPELNEKISWGMPTFYLDRNIIHFAAAKNHIGIYPGGEVTQVFAKELAGFKTSKGAIQWPYDKDFDTDLLKTIIEFNLLKR